MTKRHALVNLGGYCVSLELPDDPPGGRREMTTEEIDARLETIYGTAPAAVPVFDRPGQLERPDSDWTRDDAGRPYLLPDPEWTPETAPPAWVKDGAVLPGRHYTRVTTFAEALLDGTMLSRWKMRRVALGMGRRPDYVVAAAALTAEDRDREALNDLAEKALEAAGPNAADIGTALHGFSERIDRGEPLGFVPDTYRADLERYREVVQEHLTWQHREERMVCDQLETAGTPDGIALCNVPDPDGVVDLLRIVDLKTGNVERTAGKFSAQLGTYANSALYDAATGRRSWLENLDRRWGLVLHMPAGVGTAELRWLNLEHGWLGAQLAGPVRRWRTINHADLMYPLIKPEPRQVPDGMCRGVKRDGGACTYKAAVGRPGMDWNFCARHQDQDPDAVIPPRVTKVAGELTAALEHVPEPLQQPATAVPMEGTEQAEADAAVEHEEQALTAWGPHRFSPASPGSWPLVCVTCGLEREDGRAEHLVGPIGDASTAVDEPVEPFDQPMRDEDGRALNVRGDPVSTPVELNGNPRPHTSMPTPEDAAEAAQKAELALMDQVRACRSTGELDLLWQAIGQAWTDSVKKYAKRHRDLLPELAQKERISAALLVAIEHADSQRDLRLLFEDPRSAGLITDEHKAAARKRAAELPPF